MASAVSPRSWPPARPVDLGRRRLLAVAAAGGLAAALPRLPAAGAPRRAPHVVVVGAGLAGLACADVLHRGGARVTVFEARPDRVGGRCWSSYGWRDRQVAEHGGEFIDTRHRFMRALVARFGLQLEDTYDGAGGRGRLWIGGDLRQPTDLHPDHLVFARRIRGLRRRIGAYTWPHATLAAREVDEMSARDVVDRYMPGGSTGLAGRRYHAYLASFLGLDLDRLGGLATVDNIDLAPGADERYHVRGGNVQVVDGLVGGLPSGAVRTDAPLRRARRRSDGRYGLRFGGVGPEVVADRVVFCLPFTALREVDLEDAQLSAHKHRCIDELGMGTNAKVLMQFAHRPRTYAGWSGFLRSDAPTFDTWESSAAQRGAASLLTVYFGGASGGTALPGRTAHGDAPGRLVEHVLGVLERHGRTHLPGLRQDWLGRARLDHWALDRWTHGSYAAFLPGQYTRFAGFAGRSEHGAHFAGEHTAPLVDQGYLNGAVRTGVRAANEVLAGFGLHRRPEVARHRATVTR